MSLNEKTGKLEPHKVTGLLNMGVKPVYKLTTKSGKTLKTTLNHPYLSKENSGKSIWKKLRDIEEGDSIAAVREEALDAFMRFFPLPMFFNSNNYDEYGNGNSQCYKYSQEHLFTSNRVDKISSHYVQNKKQIDACLCASRKFEKKLTGKCGSNSDFSYIHQRFAEKLFSTFDIHIQPLSFFNFIPAIKGIMELIICQGDIFNGLNNITDKNG